MGDLTDVILGEGGPSEYGYHQISSFLSCNKKFQYEKVRGIRKPMAQTPDHFAIGQLFHAGRAHWFAQRFDTSAEAFERCKAAMQKAAEENKLPVTIDAERTALRYLQEYIDHYSIRPLPDPIAAEYLVGPTELDGVGTLRTARLDDVSRYFEAGGKLCIGESKTTGADIGTTINEYTLHGQPMLQALLWELSSQGAAQFGPVDGVMLDIVQKGRGGERCKFARVVVPIKRRVLDWYRENLVKALRAAANVTWESSEPRRITSCTEMHGGARVACTYRDLCINGAEAAMDYVTTDGQYLDQVRPVNGVEIWE